VDRRLIEATLAECGNVKRKAAEVLGISLKTLYNRLAAYHSQKSEAAPAAKRGERERERGRERPANR
jgi:DNA-binding NtrC family response regulator